MDLAMADLPIFQQSRPDRKIVGNLKPKKVGSARKKEGEGRNIDIIFNFYSERVYVESKPAKRNNKTKIKIANLNLCSDSHKARLVIKNESSFYIELKYLSNPNFWSHSDLIKDQIQKQWYLSRSSISMHLHVCLHIKRNNDLPSKTEFISINNYRLTYPWHRLDNHSMGRTWVVNYLFLYDCHHHYTYPSALSFDQEYE